MNSEDKLHEMYVKYCINQPLSEHIVKNYKDYFEKIRLQLNHKLTVFDTIANLTLYIILYTYINFSVQIHDLLMQPVQRIVKYKLLLKAILKYTELGELVDEILELHHAILIVEV